MLGFRAKVKKAELQLSQEVDSAEWVSFENALEKLREGSIAWQLVKRVIEEQEREYMIFEEKSVTLKNNGKGTYEN